METFSKFESEQPALNNCERVPIHIPARVQSGVSLIAFQLADFKTVGCSENCQPMLGLSHEKILGLDINDVFANRKIIHAIRGALSLPSIKLQRERIGRFTLQENGQDKFDIALSLGGDLGILEIEPVLGDADQAEAPVFLVRTILASLNYGEDLQGLLDSGVSALRQLTGYDRVMGCKFLPCGAGEVVAEGHSPGVASYLGLRYPAHDIPSQERALMVRQSLRMIEDVDDPHSNVRSIHHEPIDMSMCLARGVSPVDVEYLSNMGVKATMNISIIVRGELWGLFAFHHYRPRRLSPDQRVVCELFGQLFSMQIQQQLEREILQRRERACSVRESLLRSDGETLDLALEALWSGWAETVNAQGLAIVCNDSIRSYGEVPNESIIRALVDSSSESIFATDCISALTNLCDESSKSAGALGIAVSEPDGTRALFFRNEVTDQVRLAGEPDTKIQHGPDGPRSSPRGSFSEHAETMTGKCEPWTQADRSVASELLSWILDLVYRDANGSNKRWRK